MATGVMPTRLPPLKALRAFEVAARQLSFLRAAEQLSVTPSAISHQIRLLEEYLGIKLFERHPNGLALTDAGFRYSQKMAEAFEIIGAATHDLVQDEQPEILDVYSAPALAIKWLMPRINSFMLEHAEINIRINASPEFVNYHRLASDLTIYYGERPSAPNYVSVPLLKEFIQPICSPEYLLRAGPLRQLSDLANHTLINANNLVSWPAWLNEHGLDGSRPSNGLWLDRSDMALDAALRGLGVALESDILSRDDRVAGRLVTPLNQLGVAQSVLSYFIVIHRENLELARVRHFCDWILQIVPEDNRVHDAKDMEGAMSAAVIMQN